MILTSKNNNLTVAVVGSRSMVGSRFCELSKQFTLIKADRAANNKVDITDKNSVENFFKNHDFQWLILFSAFTDVDSAETQRNNKKGLCWQINVQGTANVASACLAHQRNLIFTSTDFIFDGTKGPYSENDPPGPNMSKVSWYGITKIEAEKIVSQKLPHFLILRISYPYRANFETKDDFAKKILHKYRQGNLYPMFSDQKLTPTFIDDLAPAITLLIKKNQKGIFHLASREVTTPYEFAKNLISTFGGNPNEIKKGSITKFLSEKNSTPRPAAGGLKVTKIIKTGFTPTNWKDGIAKIYSQSRNQLI